MSTESNRVKLALVGLMLLYCVLQVTFGKRRGGAKAATAAATAAAASEGEAAFDLQQWSNMSWVYESSSSGIITYSKKVPKSKLLAFRGLIEIPHHISHAMGPFIDLSLAHLWIEYMTSIKRLEDGSGDEARRERRELESFCRRMESATEGSVRESGGTGGPARQALRAGRRALSRLGRWLRREEQCSAERGGSHVEATPPRSSKRAYTGDIDTIYQTFDLPWPIQDRDILLRRRFCYSKSDRSVTVYYRSTTDARAPEDPSYIRSFSPHTVWRFQSSTHAPEATLRALAAAQARSPPSRQCAYRGDRRAQCTVLSIEVVVDSKGSIPAAFINYIQKSFPAKSLGEYVKLINRKLAQDHAAVEDW